MNKKLLFFLMTMSIISLSSVSHAQGIAADAAGIYKGKLTVEVTEEGSATFDDQKVTFEANGENAMNLKLANFAFSGQKVGDIAINNVALTQDGNQITFDVPAAVISIENPGELGPMVIQLLTGKTGTLKGTITDKKDVNLDISLPILGEIKINFAGTKEGTSINVAAKQKLTVYPSTATESLYVEGIEDNEPYAIYNIAGNLLKSGKLNNASNITVAGLSRGIYFLQIAGRTTKFIKK